MKVGDDGIGKGNSIRRRSAIPVNADIAVADNRAVNNIHGLPAYGHFHIIFSIRNRDNTVNHNQGQQLWAGIDLANDWAV